jgi:hypothetical protein
MNGKENEIHIYTGILFSHRKWNLVFYNNLDGTGDHFKWNKPGTEWKVPHYLAHMWNLKSWSHRSWEQKSGYQRLRESSGEQKMGVANWWVWSYSWVGIRSSCVLLHSSVTTDNKNVLHISKI